LQVVAAIKDLQDRVAALEARCKCAAEVNKAGVYTTDIPAAALSGRVYVHDVEQPKKKRPAKNLEKNSGLLGEE
jgi:hypothetical protein